jgi:hypothetical protein
MKLKFHFYTISLILNNAFASPSGGYCLGTLKLKTENQIKVLKKNLSSFSFFFFFKHELVFMVDFCLCEKQRLIIS